MNAHGFIIIMNSVAGGTKLNAKINLTYILSKGENLKPENLDRF